MNMNEKGNTMKKIGILSDTHGLLRPEVLNILQGCDAILHGGDINRQDIIDTLEKTAPLYVVRGNNDKEWAEKLPEFLDFSLFGLHMCMTHKKKELPKDLHDYDLVIYGHSHKYEEKREGTTLLLNPGSCGPRRFNQEITMAVLNVSDQGQIQKICRIDIPHRGAAAIEKPADSIDRNQIERVIREIHKGRSVSQIASALKMDPGITEQICRLVLTHPGVDADGIMTKMGL